MTSPPPPRPIERISSALQAQAYFSLIVIIAVIAIASIYGGWSPADDQLMIGISIGGLLLGSALGTLAARILGPGRVAVWLLGVLAEVVTFAGAAVGLEFVSQFSALAALLVVAEIAYTVWVTSRFIRGQTRRFFFASRSAQ